MLFNTFIKTHENQANWNEVGEVFPWKLLEWLHNFTRNKRIPKLHINNRLFSLELVAITCVHSQQHPARNRPLTLTPIRRKTEVWLKLIPWAQLTQKLSINAYISKCYYIWNTYLFIRIIVQLGIWIYSMKRMVNKCGFGPSRLQELKWQLWDCHISNSKLHSRQVVSCPVQPRARHWSCVFWRDFSGVKRTCWTTGSWRSCLSLEVVSSIPAWSTIIYRFLCGSICVSLCQSIKIKPTNMYIASARAQFKINTHRCWNWHHVHSRQVVSCPVQPRARHWSCVFLARFQWREAYVLDNWQLAELPQSGGREFDPRLVHDNLSVPLWVYMRFPVPEHQN